MSLSFPPDFGNLGLSTNMLIMSCCTLNVNHVVGEKEICVGALMDIEIFGSRPLGSTWFHWVSG
jgi:hypothetical protein